MILEVQEVKEWLRVDHDEDDRLIDSLIRAAEQYLTDATGKEFDNKNEKAKLFCLFLISDWYDNRQYTVGKVGEQVKYIVQSMLAQLKYGGDENEI